MNHAQHATQHLHRARTNITRSPSRVSRLPARAPVISRQPPQRRASLRAECQPHGHQLTFAARASFDNDDVVSITHSNSDQTCWVCHQPSQECERLMYTVSCRFHIESLTTIRIGILARGLYQNICSKSRGTRDSLSFGYDLGYWEMSGKPGKDPKGFGRTKAAHTLRVLRKRKGEPGARKLSNDFDATQVWPQHFRHDDAAILLLIIFHDGDESPRQRQP